MRKANFTPQELRMLIDVCRQNAPILLNRFNSADIKFRKAQIWEEITSLINRLGVAHRKSIDVRKKWIDLKSTAIKLSEKGDDCNDGFSEHTNKHGRRRPWYIQMVLQILKNSYYQPQRQTRK